MKFNLPKGLLDSVSGIVNQSKQVQAEQAQQSVDAMKQKFGSTVRPLTAEQLAAIPEPERKDKAVNASISSIMQKSFEESKNERSTAASRIDAMYGRAGAARPVTETKKINEAEVQENWYGHEDPIPPKKPAAVGTKPTTAKQKRLAALAGHRGRITQADVLAGRGVKQKNEEVEVDAENEIEEGKMLDKLKAGAKKVLAKVGGGSDEDQLKRLQKNMGVPQTGKKPEVKEEVEQVKEGIEDRHSEAHDDFHQHIDKVADVSKRKDLKKQFNTAMKGFAKHYEKDNEDGMDDHLSNMQHLAKQAKQHASIKEESEVAEERSSGTVFDKDVAKSFSKKKPGEMTGHDSKKTSTGMVYTKKAKKEKEEVEEAMDTPGNGRAHQCAIHVKHAKLGEGKTLFSQHAEPDADGHIEWYDVMFAESIERVETKDLEILVSESHMNHKKK